MEKEILEEMAQEYFENSIFCDGITEFEHSITIRSYIAGAKLQAERMYSEEEVVYFIHKFLKEHQPQLPYMIGGINMWFGQFKKK
jgi:hypothetical protein